MQALAQLCLRTERSSEALAFASQAVSLDPAAAANHLTLGKVLASRGDTQGAIRAVRRAIEIDSSDSAGRYLLSRLYLKAGDRDSSERELAAYRELIATYRAR